MGAFFAKIGGWLVTSVLPVVLNFVFGKLKEWWKERQEKNSDDKRVDDATDKAKDPDLSKRLDGTKDLEGGFNDHA